MAAAPLQPSRSIRSVSGLNRSVDRYFHRPEVLNEITLIVAWGGDDRYDSTELALGAALIVVDHAGDDSYVGIR
jgi:hypothetical protein